MERVEVVKATEQELLELVNQHYGTHETSIQEIMGCSDDYFVTKVIPCKAEHRFFLDTIDSPFVDVSEPAIRGFKLPAALNSMCYDGVLEAGEYIVDCKQD